MKLGTWSIDPKNTERVSAPLLILFFEPFEDASTNGEIVNLFFHEAYRIASTETGKCVHWARGSPLSNAPNVCDSVWLNPKCLDRIFIHYDERRDPYTAATELCCQHIYKSVLSPYCIFVELFDADISSRDAAAVLALLAHTSKWILQKRDAADADVFAAVVALRDCDDVRMCASLYSDYLMRFKDGKLCRIP